MEMVARIRNPMTKRMIKANGETAMSYAVRERLRTGRAPRGTSRTGSEGYPVAVGTPKQVWYGTALKTPGGVRRDGLIRKVDKWGKARIVFKSRREAAMRNPALMIRAEAARASGRFGPVM